MIGVGGEPIRVLLRGGEHYHRQEARPLIGADRRQHLQAVHPGHLQIEQHHRRQPALAPGMRATGEEPVERIDAIIDPHHRIGDAGLGEGAHGQLGVVVVVLREQDRFVVAHDVCLP